MYVMLLYLQTLPLYVAIFLIGISLYTLVAVYAERKISAFIQDRMGPMETGPIGTLQTLADLIKLLSKEPIVPGNADKILFVVAPGFMFVTIFMALAALPISPGISGSDFSSGLLYIIGIASLDIMGLLMAAWSSANKYALLGAARAIAQIISYEIPATLALLTSVVMFGTLSMQEICVQQGIHATQDIYWLGLWEVSEIGGLPAWAIFRYPHLIIAYIIFFIASLAECNRAPFDIPEAESELVSGYHVEYGGFRFALIFLSEYGKMFLVSMLAAVVFWGGWNTPLPNINLGSLDLSLASWTSGSVGTLSGVVWGSFWLLLKTLIGVGIQIWIRWTYPRVRADQLTHISWKILTPMTFVLLLISVVWRLLEVQTHL